MNWNEIIGMVFFFSCVAFFIYNKVKHNKEIWESVKGEDGKLSLTETVAFWWLILYPIAFFSDLSQWYEVSERAWTSLDVIFTVTIAGDVAHKKFQK